MAKLRSSGGPVFVRLRRILRLENSNCIQLDFQTMHHGKGSLPIYLEVADVRRLPRLVLA